MILTKRERGKLIGENSQYFKWLMICNSQSCFKPPACCAWSPWCWTKKIKSTSLQEKKNTFRFLKAPLAPGTASQTRLIASLKRQEKKVYGKWNHEFLHHTSEMHWKRTAPDGISAHRWRYLVGQLALFSLLEELPFRFRLP